MYVETPPDFSKLIEQSVGVPGLLSQGLGELTGNLRYPHWENIKRREFPEGVEAEDVWLVLKASRLVDRKFIPLEDTQDRPFSFGTPDIVNRLLHEIDRECSGQIAMPAVLTGGHVARQRFIVNSRMEEAIRSSQLEGATTTRQVAKEMLRSGRDPATKSERMIVNNFRAMEFIREASEQELTPELVLGLHSIVSSGTLDDSRAEGRLQTVDEERVSVVDALTGEAVHRPPNAAELPARLKAMCAFANQPDDPETFIHPVVRAVILHFWLAYDHPFVDGNGRTARALFYWYMLRHGYWLIEFISISRVLRSAPSKYGRAFLYTETDDNDLTYFVVHQLETIVKSVADLHDYLSAKAEELSEVETLTHKAHLFNNRQLALLSLAIKDPTSSFTFQSHASSHGVTHESARNDITALWEMGLLDRQRDGRGYRFTPVANIGRAIKRVALQD